MVMSPPVARVFTKAPDRALTLRPVTATRSSALMSPSRLTSPAPAIVTDFGRVVTVPDAATGRPIMPASCIVPAPVSAITPPAPVSMVAPDRRTGSPPATLSAPVASTAPAASMYCPCALMSQPSASIRRPCASTKALPLIL